MERQQLLLEPFEVHDPQGIRRALEAGASASAPVQGLSSIEHFVAGYLRSERFAACLDVLLEHGAVCSDRVWLALLRDDAEALAQMLARDARGILAQRFTFANAFTCCRGVGALHVCAEFNSQRCAELLLDHGADVNDRAAIDARGRGGQTPVFHAVNAIFNFSRPVLERLIAAGAHLDLRLDALLWGQGQAWETLLVDVTPLSYAQAGLMRQFQRKESDVYANLSLLHRARHGSELDPPNVPNRYLQQT